MEKLIAKKLDQLNQITFFSIVDEDNLSIIKKFAEESIDILKADFGYAWGKLNGNKIYQLVYKSPNTPYSPIIDEKRNGTHIIPIRYGDHMFGSIILGYKKQRVFTPLDLALSNAIGKAAAQAMTINWLVEKENKALALVEKQKEIEVLLEQEKLRTEFIANAVHEFRTPLAIIRGNIELALRDKKQNLNLAKNALKIIHQEVLHLSAMMIDLATLTSPKSQKGTMHFAEVDIDKLLKKITTRVKVLLLRHKKVFLKITDDSPPTVITGDEKYLEKLFMNLIRNAITYSKEKGHITVNVHKGHNTVKIEIADDGVGISKEELPRIFDRFFRTEKAREMSDIGTGLGLAICKWVVESHKGTIEVTSTEDKGSTFTVVLPISAEKSR